MSNSEIFLTYEKYILTFQVSIKLIHSSFPKKIYILQFSSKEFMVSSQTSLETFFCWADQVINSRVLPNIFCYKKVSGKLGFNHYAGIKSLIDSVSL